MNKIVTCPECGAGWGPPHEPHFQLDVIYLTTREDADLGLTRIALRCQNCGFAGSFIGKTQQEGTHSVSNN